MVGRVWQVLLAVVVWIVSVIAVGLSAVYVTAAIRIWQRRSKLWGLFAAANSAVYTYLTALYLWDAANQVERRQPTIIGLVTVIFPAILIFRFVTWGFRDEAAAAALISEVEHRNG